MDISIKLKGAGKTPHKNNPVAFVPFQAKYLVDEDWN